MKGEVSQSLTRAISMLENYFKSNLINLFIFGCAGALLLRGLFLVTVIRGYSLVLCKLLSHLVACLVTEHGL